MLLVPDPATFRVNPWPTPEGSKVARMICDIYLPDGTPFAGCPRMTLKRQVEKARKLGYTMVAGPEAEFFLFQKDEQGQDPGRDPRRRRLLRPDAGRPRRGVPARHRAGARGDGLRGRGGAPRGRPRPARDRLQVRRGGRTAPTTSRPSASWSRRWRSTTACTRPSCPSRSSASTARACTPTSRCSTSRASNAFYDAKGQWQLSKRRAGVHRRHPRARARLRRGHQPAGQLLQAPGAGLRGADQPRLVGEEPQPAGAGAGQARHVHPLRGAHAGPGLQPLPGVRGDARRGPRRRAAQARPRAAGEQEHLRDERAREAAAGHPRAAGRPLGGDRRAGEGRAGHATPWARTSPSTSWPPSARSGRSTSRASTRGSRSGIWMSTSGREGGPFREIDRRGALANFGRPQRAAPTVDQRVVVAPSLAANGRFAEPRMVRGSLLLQGATPHAAATEEPARRAGGDPHAQGPVRGPALRGSARHLAALLGPRRRARRLELQRGARLRRLLDPRLPEDPGERHAAHAGRDERLPGPVRRGADADPDLRRQGPDHRQDVLARSAQRRQEGRGLPQGEQAGRRLLLGPGGRVLRLQRHPLRPGDQPRLLLHRLPGGELEHRRQRPAQPGLQAAGQGGLLPDPARRQPARHPQRDGVADDGRGRRGRGAPPRGGDRRAVRDRPAVRLARPGWPTS